MPVFNLQLEFDESGAAVAVRRLNDVSNAANNAGKAGSKAGSDIERAFSKLKKQAIEIISVCKALEKAISFANRGLELNASLEQSRIGIASLITSMVKLEDAQGNALTGAQKYAAAQGMAAETMAEIQRLGLATTATTQDLVEGVQSIMGPALQAGMALKDIPQFAVAGAQAMQTLGVPLNQMRTELEALLSGNINKSQDVLAPKLFADVKGDLNEYIKGLKESGKLIEEINRRLDPFRQAGEDVAQTWNGLVSNLDEAVDTIAGIVTKGLMNDLKESVSIISDFLVGKNDTGQTDVAKEFQNIAELLAEISDRVGGAILETTKYLVELGKSFNGFLGDENSIIFLDKLTNGLKLAAAAIVTLGISSKANLSSVTLTAPFTAAIGAIRNYRNALTGLMNVGRGVLGMFGGPWGMAITAAGMAFTELAFCESKAERATRLHTEAQEAYSRVLGSAIDKNGNLVKSLNAVEKAELEAANKKARADLSAQISDFRTQIHNIIKDASKITFDQEDMWNEGLGELPENIKGKNNDIITLGNNLNDLLSELASGKIPAEEFAQKLDALKNQAKENHVEFSDFYDVMSDMLSNGTFIKAAQQAETTGNAMRQLAQQTASAKQVMADGWNIDLGSIEGVVKSLNGQIKNNLIELGNAKNIKEIYTVIPDISVEEGKALMSAYGKTIKETKDETKALGAALDTLGEKGKTVSEDSRKGLAQILPLQQKAMETAKQLEDKRKAGSRGAGSAARSAAIAQIDYQSELERTREQIESLQQQLDLDKGEDLTKAKIRIEQKYQQEISKTKEEIAKNVARGQLPQAKADELLGEKTKAADLERQLALKEAQNKADEKARQNLETTISFYRELEQLSGQYGLSTDYQNELLAQQAEELSRTKPELQGYIDEWIRLKQLQNDTSFMGGLERGVRKFGAEYGDLASQVESLTMQMGSTIGNTLADAFMKGKFSAQDFFSSLISMAAQAASNYFIGMIFKGIGGFFGPTPSTGTGMSASSAAAAAQTSGYSGMGVRFSGMSAHGNVFSGGSLSAYSGSIVSTPTFFSYNSHYDRFAKGAGLMGEAGPEAIMPLSRASNGDLGVRLMYDDDWKHQPSDNYMRLIADMQAQIRKERQEYASGMPNVNVNITNNSNAQVEAGQMRSDGNGGFSMDIIISQVEQGIVGRMKQGKSQLAQYQEKAYGMSRAGVLARGRGRA